MDPISSTTDFQNDRTEALPPIDADIPCLKCGYNLRSLTGNHCPECGESLEPLRSLDPQIPWVHRERLGAFRAYWQTVFLVLRKRKRLCWEMVRPVSFADSQRFRWVAVLHVWVPIVLASLLVYCLEASAVTPGAFGDDVIHDIVMAGWPLVTWCIAVFLALAAVTGLPSCFFHPRALPLEQQNRAVALSYYACAPLAWAPIPIAMAMAASVVYLRRPVVAACLGGVALFLLAVLVVAWWGTLIELLWHVRRQRRGRAVLVAVMFLVLFFLLWMLFIYGLPLVVLYVLLIRASLS
jgi:hypothetical protein